MAAACHDAGHNGLNNDFLIKSKSSLLEFHKEPSVLENYHLFKAFQLINKNKNYEKYYNITNGTSRPTIEEKVDSENVNKIDCNFFQTLSEFDQARMEDMIRFSVLGTDMNTYHKIIRQELTTPANKPPNIYTK